MNELMKGFTLLRLIIVLAIIGVLMSIPSILYHNYIVRAKIASMLGGIGSEKIKLAEQLRGKKNVNYNQRILLDTNHIVDNSMIVISPFIVVDNVNWGCTTVGLSDSQVPQFCRMNNFTSSQINIGSELNCKLSQGISYNELTTKFSVNVKINGGIIVIGDFDNIKEAAASYLDYLEV